MFNRKPKDQARRQRPLPPDAQRSQQAVFSYRASRSAYSNNVGRTTASVDEEAARRKPSRLRWLHSAPRLLALVLIAVLVFINLSLSTAPRIVPVGDSSARLFLRDQATYSRTVQQVLKDSVWNNNKITFDSSQVTAQLRHTFPELAAISVSLPLVGHRPVVYIQPSLPKAMVTTTAGSSFVLDANGRALIDSKQVVGLGRLTLPIVTDQSGLSVSAGQIALPRATVSFVSQVAAQLQAKGVGVDSYVLPAASSELDVKVMGVPYFVKFNLQGDAREEAGAFLAVKQHLDAQAKTPGQYVDVRVPDRAYYK